VLYLVSIEELIKIARKKVNCAYAKYSGIRIVAILITASDKVYHGVNIENASYGLTICAERVAIFKAVSEGEKEFKLLLVYSPDVIPWPCGACRQVMAEFFSPDTPIIIVSDAEDKIYTKELRMKELLPFVFKIKE